MPVSKAQMAANKKYDSIHFKYQSVKLKAKEYEQLKKAVDLSKEPMNSFLRTAIMQRVGEYVPDETPNAETIQRDNEAALSAPVQPEEVEPDSTVAFHSEQVYDLTPHQRAAPVDVLGLSVRTYNMIRRAGCETVGELVEYLHTDKCVIPHEGKAYREIEDALNEFAGK